MSSEKLEPMRSAELINFLAIHEEKNKERKGINVDAQLLDVNLRKRAHIISGTGS